MTISCYSKIIVHRTECDNNTNNYKKEIITPNKKKINKGDGGIFDELFQKELDKIIKK